MASSTSTATPSRHAFDQRVDSLKAPKSDINALILDYLTMEGYPNAAANFSREANLPPQQETSSIVARQEIQNLIHSGQVEMALKALNDYDPELLDEDETLHFSLLRLQLVELIRSCKAVDGDISPALKFATDHLGPRASTNPQSLEDLERTMALLLFPSDLLEPQIAALLKPDLRQEAADNVNKAILDRQSKRREAAIRNLVKMRAWAENAAREKGISLPAQLNIGLHVEETDEHQGPSSGNGHEPMVTT